MPGIAKRLIIWIEAKVKAAGFKKAQKEAASVGLIVKKNGQFVDMFTKKTVDSAKAQKSLFFQTRRFRMELLSLMFGFMMLNKALMSFMKNLVLTYNKAYEKQDSFIFPVYDLQEYNAHIPDLRNCLYWKPNLLLLPGKEQSLEFYTSDNRGEYIILLRGVGEENNPVEWQFKFRVE